MSIEVQLEEIKYFLLKVHPYLENPNNTECIEIRPISRENDYDFKLSKPLNIWKINEKSIDLLRNFLELEHIEEPTTIKNIANVLDISTRALSPTINSLAKTKHLFKHKANRREKQQYTYYTSKIIRISKGYTRLSFNDIKSYLSELNNNEIKVYMFMLSKCFDTYQCYFSQETIGEQLDLKQNTISNIMKNLQKKYFIKITKTHITKHVFYCTYTLLR